MRNRPMFPNLRKTKAVVTPEGESLTLKTCEICDGEFLGDKFETKCEACRVAKKKKSRARSQNSVGFIGGGECTTGISNPLAAPMSRKGRTLSGPNPA